MAPHPPAIPAPAGQDRLAYRSLPPRRRVKLVLHRGIVSGTIPGGTRLRQASIAEELAVSTRLVRDALQELAAEGFVRIDDRGGAVVRELCRSELEDIYEIRSMLEPVAAARAASRHPGRARLLPAIELLAAMESETDGTQWADHNARFHHVIDQAAGSRRLIAILANLREHSSLYITHSVLAVPGRARSANAEHEAILRAVLAGDPEAAASAALGHLDATLAALCTVRPIMPGSQSRH
jgi:DNA-binding GntR family transcriptional regulator